MSISANTWKWIKISLSILSGLPAVYLFYEFAADFGHGTNETDQLFGVAVGKALLFAGAINLAIWGFGGGKKKPGADSPK